jgi:hypothetical protein
MKSVRTQGTWGSPTLVSGPAGVAFNQGYPDTDGDWIVYESNGPSATGSDICFQPLAGGPETQLAIPGTQRSPSIKAGVIVFESAPDTFNATSDIYVYIIATHTLLQLTDTPSVNETLSDIDLLPNGNIRVVWAADDGIAGEFNLYALTVTPP